MAGQRWTGGDGRRSASAADKIFEEGGPPPFNPSAGPDMVNRCLKNNLRRFWAQHAEGFRQMWTELSLKGKKKMLHSCVANMPEKPTDKLKQGKSLQGPLLLTPEMNVQDLVASGERCLLALFDGWCSSQLADDLAHAREMARGLLSRKKVPTRFPNEYVLLEDMDNLKAGQAFECKQQVAVETFQRLERGGVALQKDVYELANARLNFILTSLALYADEFRTEVLGLDNFFVASPLRGCSACGRTETPEGRELRGCRDCVNESIVMYCSKACQRAHFASHKSACYRLKKQGPSDTCQVCGDAKAEGGGALKQCARCQAKYCGRECQLAAWHAGHKLECHASAA